LLFFGVKFFGALFLRKSYLRLSSRLSQPLVYEEKMKGLLGSGAHNERRIREMQLSTATAKLS